MALVDTRFNSYLPDLAALASNNVVKSGSTTLVKVVSLVSPGTIKVNVTPLNLKVPINTALSNSVVSYQENNLFVPVLNNDTKVISDKFISSTTITSTNKIVANVATVVVEKESLLFGRMIPFEYATISVSTSTKTFPTDGKPLTLHSIKVATQNFTERKNINPIPALSRYKVETVARRTSNIMQNKIISVNVIYNANTVVSGNGGGGEGGGDSGGVLTEYWS